MIELNEKAGNYAEENVIKVLKEAFAKVYADGYRDGYKDREDEIPVGLRNNEINYIDLGLPSGTLWADDYEKIDNRITYVTYDKAVLHKIPTKEQCDELVKHCRFNFKAGPIFECIGPNGNYIQFRPTSFIKTTRTEGLRSQCVYFWHIDDEDQIDSTNAFRIMRNEQQKLETNSKRAFIGYKLPIRLIKTKEL